MASTKMYLSVLLFLILIVPIVSGSISVQNIAISPTGDLISGQDPPQKVSVSYGINFISSGGVTFSDSDTLGMSTDLDNAHWNYTIILDSNPNTPQVANGKKLDISGWDLSYPSRRDLSIKVILTGDVPVVPATQQKTLIDIADYTANGPVPGSEVIKQANVILPGSVPLTATSTTRTPGVTNPQTPITSPVPTSTGASSTNTVPAAGSFNISPEILMIIFLLISFIPLGLLVFHDYFGLGRLTFPQSFSTRGAFAIVYALCGVGLLFVMSVVQDLYKSFSPSITGFGPVFTVIVLFMVSYFALSAFVLAVGSVLSKAFRWTLKVHIVTGVIALFVVPITLYMLGSPSGAAIAAVIVIVAAIISALLALLQDHSLAHGPGKDWYTSIRDIFRRKETVGPQNAIPNESARAISILNTRLANGEISLQEYQQLKEAIKKP
jgi:hypothetical protein